jgi:hypothetical protein
LHAGPYLRNLTFPPFPALVWPEVGECGCSGLGQPVAHGVLIDRDAAACPLVYDGIDGPPTVGRVLDMLLNGVVALFPAIELSVADETHAVVSAVAGGFVEESGARELRWMLACRLGMGIAVQVRTSAGSGELWGHETVAGVRFLTDDARRFAR